ncbi:cyclase [Thermobifida alba]|uniref:Cyclase n=1 Tax=Thermobifida alba TaxID=53522 RepID=A0ABY4KZF4_THEAE|nr:aromatase/cyclase [Thermobifida alba]UPT20824.1 cyclase [Thermobifida alba]
MNRPETKRTRHRIEVSAPAERVYALIAAVEDWAWVFGPTIHVDREDLGAGRERIHIWATANGDPKGWTSLRELDPTERTVRFRQEVSRPPVASMRGQWRVEPGGDGCLVVLEHEFQAVDGDAAAEAWITRAIRTNSGAELAALKERAETPVREAGLLLEFSDEVHVEGDPADVYDFLHEAGEWEARLPHVARVALEEDTVNIQRLEMDTRAADGGVHTTESVRVCFPRHRIVYKQLRTPELLAVHTGCWEVAQAGSGALVTSFHTVVLAPDAVPRVLGPGADIEKARSAVRDALGRNSRATMERAGAYAQKRACR